MIAPAAEVLDTLAPWIFSTIAVPLLAALVLAAAALGSSSLTDSRERLVSGFTFAAVAFAAIASWTTLVLTLASPRARVVLIWHWLGTLKEGLDLALWIDPLAAVMMVTTTMITLAAIAFSRNYLHREPGFLRYHILVLVFCGGMLLLVMSDSYLLVFVGWEITGVCSALLIGFYEERDRPARAGLRAFATNRFGDLGLLLAIFWLSKGAGGVDFASAHAGTWTLGQSGADLVACSLLVAAFVKSAQLPVSNWLTEAIEGPSTTSGLFYGAVMVNAGVYLLLRSAPLLERSSIAVAVLLLVAVLTFIWASTSGAAATDAKSILVYATVAQLAGIFACIALRLYDVAVVLMALHAGVRMLQFIRAPSAIADARAAQRASVVLQRELGPAADRVTWSRTALLGIVVALALLALSVASRANWVSEASDRSLSVLEWLLTAFIAGGLLAASKLAGGLAQPRHPLAIWAWHQARQAWHLRRLQDGVLVQPLLLSSSALEAVDARWRRSRYGAPLLALLFLVLALALTWPGAPAAPRDPHDAANRPLPEWRAGKAAALTAAMGVGRP